MKGSIIVHHQFKAELIATLLGHRYADQSAPMLAHEVDHFGACIPGGRNEVALVLAVFVVHHNNHFSCLNIFNSAFYSMEHLFFFAKLEQRMLGKFKKWVHCKCSNSKALGVPYEV